VSVFPLPVRVRIAPGADLTADPATWTWQDITAWVRPGITITRGRSDEGGSSQPSSCALTLRNPDGRWLPGQPRSPEYPGWQTDCPVQVQVSVGGTWWTRYTGFAAEIEPRLASDRAHDTYEVDVVVSDVLRRLAQGSAVRSPLLRQLSALTLDGYCPLEDAAGTTAPAGYAGSQPPSRAVGVTFGQRDDGLPGAASVARLDTTTSAITMSATGRTIVAGDTLVSTVMFYVTSPSLGSEADLMTIITSGQTVDRMVVRASTAGLRVNGYREDAQVGTVYQAWPAGVDPTTGWVGVQVTLTRPGLVPYVQITVSVHAVGSLAYTSTTSATITTISPTMGRINRVTALAAGVSGTSFAHLAVRYAATAAPSTAWAASGYSGEDAGARLERLAADQGVPLAPVGVAETAMGPQAATGLLDLARDVEAADGGILLGGLDGRLAYVTRISRYNRATDSAVTYGQLVAPLRPTGDDRFTRNDWTVSRPGGSGGTQVVDEEHIARHGRWEQSASVNVADDPDLGNQAGWRVHLGTVEQMRYPILSINFGRAEAAPLLPVWLAADPIGTRITVTGVPAAMAVDGVIDQHIEGYTEQLDRFGWTVSINATPAEPWVIAVADGPTRAPAAGSTLAADLSATGMSFSLASTADNGLWTTDPSDFPMDLMVGGEPVTASSITGTVSPQTVNLSARGLTGWQRTWPAGTPVDVRQPAVAPL